MISEFAKEKVFWTTKMNLKLVKFIQNRPHMWNQRHPKYTSSAMKDQTYAEFAAEYGNEFTGRAVKDRWTNIRTTFAHHLRKLKDNENEDYKVKWHLWNACQFLKNSGKVKSENIDFDSLFDIDLNSDVDPKHDTAISETEEKGCEYETADSLNCSNVAEQLLQVFKGVQNDAFGAHNSKHSKVGRSVAKKLAGMNSYDAARLSNEIMNVLLLYDDNNPNNPNYENK